MGSQDASTAGTRQVLGLDMEEEGLTLGMSAERISFWVWTCGLVELQCMYVVWVDDIFGRGGAVGCALLLLPGCQPSASGVKTKFQHSPVQVQPVPGAKCVARCVESVGMAHGYVSIIAR